MNRKYTSKCLRGTLVALLTWGLTVPSSALSADKAEASPQIRPTDVALAKGALLIGRAIDTQGNPAAGTAVSVLHNNRVIARARSDARGQWQIRGLRTGIHTVVVSKREHIVRLWDKNVAPPVAKHRVTVVAGDKLTRAQFGALGDPSILNPVTIGLVGLAVGGLVLSIQNNNDIDDLKKSLASP